MAIIYYISSPVLGDRSNGMSRRQGIFWLLTIPHYSFTPYLPKCCRWIKGQLELGSGGFLHWQILVAFCKKTSLRGCRDCFGPHHGELTRSVAATEYVWKDDTSVAGTRFELGVKPIDRSNNVDWERVWELAKLGDFDQVPASVRVQSYRTLRTIASDYASPVAIERECFVYWGPTGTGKSRRAWSEAGLDAFPKDPRTKFWCGYRGHEHVVIDEFRGDIAIGHLLRWLDRYPVNVEIKGSSTVLKANSFWITSNLSPEQWYPDVDAETFAALRRRLKVTNFSNINILT